MCWTRSENVVWEELDGCALLVDVKSGARWRLNAAASRAWKLCDGTRTLSEISKALRQSHASLADLCYQFTALGLLRVEAIPAGAMTMARSTENSPFSFQALGLGAGSRRRPSPRGNSGPG